MDSKIQQQLFLLSKEVQNCSSEPLVVQSILRFCKAHYSTIHKSTYKFILKAIRLALKHKMHPERLALNAYKAFYLLHHEKRLSAKKLGLEIKGPLLELRFFFEFGLIHIILSQIEWSSGKLEQAFLILNGGLDQLKYKKNKKAALVQLHWMLGVFYYDLNDSKRSFYHYKLSYKSILSSTDIAMRAYIQIGLATIHAKQKNFSRAEELFQITVSISKANDLWLVESRSHYELGMLKKQEKNFVEAEKKMQVSFEIRKENGAIPAMLSSMIGIVEVLIAQNKYPKAESVLTQALQISTKRNLKSKKSKISYLFSVIYEEMGELEKAYSYLKEHYLLEKEIGKSQQRNTDKYFQLMYNMQKAQKDADFQKLLNSELKRSNDIILSQKKKLQSGNKEKEVLLKEIHHRVKNNLQIITSLLSLQAVNTSPATQRLLNNSQHRINSMSLIHEMLYQSDKLSEVNYHDYLKQLINKLIWSFKGRNHRIQIHLKVPEIYLSIDTAIPLSLLINEVVTNALKYAFTEEKNGLLSLNLQEVAPKQYTLFIGDDGPGLPPGFNWKKSKSLGMKLIFRLTKQISGFIALDDQIEGTHYFLRFKD